MSTTKTEPVWSYCNHCETRTRHDIVCHSEQRGDDEYDCWIQHAVVECRGCATRSFRYHFKDIENAFPTSNDEWDVPEEIKTYPRSENREFSIDGIELVPDIVRTIYLETVSAIYEEAYLLAGLGLRGTIEAVCNDQSVTGRSLDTRIKNLATQGLISKKDSERLHAIRFLGNDAAHEIKKPTAAQIIVAVKIVKHLIASVYTLQKEADGALDTVVSAFDEYLKLIKSRLKSTPKGAELPVVAIIGKDIRRLGDNRADLEKELLSEIAAGNVTELKVGKVSKYAGSKDDLQHYVVQ